MQVEVFKVSNTFIQNQCYLIHQNGEGLLIDPAWESNKIEMFCTQNQIKILGILLTHSHQDHTNLSNPLSFKYGCPVYMSRIEINFYTFNCHNLIPIEHHQSFIINELKVTPILTPGHTKGSVCYQIGTHLFTGDTIFIEGVGICTQNGGNPDEMFDSVQFIKTNLPSDILIWPGHSYGQEPGKKMSFLMKNNIYFQFEKKQFIEFRMRKNGPNLLGKK